MLVKFNQEYLEEIYTTGKCSDKKHRFQPGVIKNYIRRVDTLRDAENVEQLFPINSLNYETLEGNEQGISSVRINDQYRLEFTVTKEGNEPVITICTLLDITNHYK